MLSELACARRGLLNEKKELVSLLSFHSLRVKEQWVKRVGWVWVTAVEVNSVVVLGGALKKLIHIYLVCICKHIYIWCPRRKCPSICLCVRFSFSLNAVNSLTMNKRREGEWMNKTQWEEEGEDYRGLQLLGNAAARLRTHSNIHTHKCEAIRMF